ncbi:DSD1 family PLP-dependent enzyme [Paraburkholderia flagellata]|uniref:DSD1 family PLP-dependent enzyme n=1 Tax=Paraburkholderia flagellata TaxID=2883241 RepID=UPI001F1FF4D2|nr:DSD1 family PLP-dependent enzyme [Paraburkholderia flagellata]
MTLTPPAPALVGDRLATVGTPSLLIDLDAFEANLRDTAAFVADHGVALRPHAKAHKSSAIALQQVEAGAAGICCQKLSEAYPFAAAGVRDIHVTNEFVGEDKLLMATELASYVQLSVCVDAVAQVNALGQAATSAGVTIDVLPEIDVGQNRCGVTSHDALFELVDAIAMHASLRFAGLQGYHGGAQHIADWVARKETASRAAERAGAFVRALQARGVRCTRVTGGGTGTFEFDVASGVYTEVQPGSYAIMDGEYGGIAWHGAVRPRNSLFVLSTIMSATRPGMVVCDVGLKGLAVDAGLPRAVTWAASEGPPLAYIAANDEHGKLQIIGSPDAGTSHLLGQRILVTPGHCDPTVNLYDQYVCFRGDRVEAIWPIDARGLSR